MFAVIENLNCRVLVDERDASTDRVPSRLRARDIVHDDVHLENHRREKDTILTNPFICCSHCRSHPSYGVVHAFAIFALQKLTNDFLVIRELVRHLRPVFVVPLLIAFIMQSQAPDETRPIIANVEDLVTFLFEILDARLNFGLRRVLANPMIIILVESRLFK